MKSRSRVKPRKPVVASVDALAACTQTVNRMQTEVLRLDRDPKATSRRRTEASAALLAALRLMTKLSGATEVTPQMILRSPHWRTIEAVILEALTPYPAALEATAAALEQLDRRQ